MNPHTPYRSWLQLKTQLLWCNNLIRPAPAGHPDHVPLYFYGKDYSNILFVVSGKAEAVRKGAPTLLAKRGQWLVLHPKERTLKFSPWARILSIAFRARWPNNEPWLARSGLMSGKAHPQLLRKARQLIRAKRKITPHWDIRTQQISQHDFFQMQGDFSEFIAALSGVLEQENLPTTHQGHLDPRVAEAQAYIDNLPPHANLNRTHLANHINLSLVQLERLFYQAKQTTLSGYHHQLKLTQAQTLLRQPGASIKQTAYHLGFSSLPHFSAWFKKRTGKSPKDWTNTII